MAGQQNFLILTQENYFDKFELDLLKKADSYYLTKKFGIGEGVDKDKLRHSQMFYNILCTDECELIDWVNKKITGQIEGCSTTIKMDSLCGIHPNINNITCAVDEYCEWSKVEW
jgi:hypothetical protein